ncbi:MAG: lipoprotein [Gammaproteobacteria bacterium]|nr:lipoprotein [Gammaproteobacteria bacterium]
MHKPTLTLIVLALGGSLGACGLKGDLYLPEPPQAVTAPQTAPAQQADDRNADQPPR